MILTDLSTNYRYSVILVPLISCVGLLQRSELSNGLYQVEVGVDLLNTHQEQ